MKWIKAVVAGVVVFCSEHAFADNFRCPNDNIVSTGDSISKVATKCDPPAFTFKRVEPLVIGESRSDGRPETKIIYVEVQEWTYNQAFSHTLIFRNGVLSEISFGGFAK